MTATSVIKEVTLIRMFDAPQELVFKAFTNREMMMQWWGPHGFSNPDCELDEQVNGKWKINMHAPQLGFPNNWCYGNYIEIDAPRKLVFTSRAFVDENGIAGIEGLNTITLEELNGKTKLTIHAKLTKLIPELSKAADGMEQGWSESLEKLNILLSDSQP